MRVSIDHLERASPSRSSRGSRSGRRYELAAIVAAWTALAAIAVLGVALAISGFEPGRESSAAEGWLVLGVFFGLLVGGPLVTLWIRRRR